MYTSRNSRHENSRSAIAVIETLESRQLLSTTLPAGLSRSDVAWIQKTDSSDSMEIALGNLAQTNASSQQVKSAGQRMVTDHTAMRQTLEQDAASLGVTVNGTLDKQDQKTVDQLSKLTGTDFDVAYSNFMVDDHKNDIGDFTHESQKTSNATLKTLATDAIPTLQQHLTLWQDSRLSGMDVKFVETANSDNTLEIMLGNLAKTNATNADVKTAGAKMVNDHTIADQQLAQIAPQLGLTLSNTLNKQDQAVYNRLSKLTGKAFDMAYSSDSVSAHRKDIAEFTHENKLTTNAPLKTFTTDQLPVLESHLSLWQPIQHAVRGE